MMPVNLFTYLLEASICQGIFYLFYWLFLQKEIDFSFNRGYMLAVLALSVIAPLVIIPVETQSMYLPQQSFSNDILSTNVLTTVPAEASPGEINLPVKSVTGQSIAFYVYLAGCVLMCLRLLYQIGFLVHIRLAGRLKLYNNYKLIYTDGKLPTSSFFGWLFWDNTQVMQPEDKELIIRHEFAHIEQHHSWDNLFLLLVKICFWFNPVIYLFGESLQEVHEYMADKTVVRKTNAATYTRLLVEQSIGLGHMIVHSFKGSPIHKRIALTQRAYDLPATGILWKKGLSILMAASICYLQACQPKEAEPALTGEFDPENTYWLSGYGISATSHRFKEGEYEYGHYPKPDVDEYAYPVGGFNPYHTYIQNNLREPVKINPVGMRKKVFVQFTVDIEGNVRNPRIPEGMGLGPGYDEEAIRVIANGPKWVPARKDRKPVEATMMEAVIFGQRESLSRFGSDYKMVSAHSTTGGPLPVEEINHFTWNLILNYPEKARKKHIEGMVVVGFTVQPDGKATNFEVIQPIHPSLDQEALRVAQLANVPWKPALRKGKAQASKILISFGFFLTD
jgi:TonB family protein